MSVQLRKISQSQQELNDKVKHPVLIYDKTNDIWAVGDVRKEKNTEDCFVAIHTTKENSSVNFRKCEGFLLKYGEEKTFEPHRWKDHCYFCKKAVAECKCEIGPARLKKMRIEHQLKIVQLSSLINVHCTALSSVERGKKSMGELIARRLGEYFKKDWKYFRWDMPSSWRKKSK